ncbi:hypothetical protein GWM83_02610, partial [Candidatus Bathyarchaeota archaeon]|nr:hypothetical protein [Candidatus Bathyarchaeota archaeon]NIR13109.1 hypothetical protein [Desulfobacterales bacterium]NIV67849.1 hypothetical protein [Candidatus Bathyarchaeota archaeon]NIW34438.1 hypothetical protein [Candidatus Bathyarchaeota archaeon]
MEPLVDEFRKWISAFEDLDIDKPETWVRSSLKFAENLVEKDVRRSDPIDAYLHDVGFEMTVPDSMNWVGQFLMDKCDPVVVEESGD